MRLFIAIELPRSFKQELARVQTEVKQVSCGGRFVPTDNFHITLHFIGETGALHDAADAIREAARDARPFLLRLTDYGAFSSGGGRTGYVGVADESGELARLYETLEGALWDRGFSRNRSRLVPHITIGRNITGDADFICPRREAFTANSIVLYESRSVRGGMEYIPVHKERIEL